MTRRLLIHIGTHKTGTTSIQNALYSEKVSLLKSGILYADTTRGEYPELHKHSSVFAAATSNDKKAQEDERRLLISELDASKASTLIISEEALSLPGDKFVRFFEPLSKQFAIEIICYLRRQDLFLESLYNQLIRQPNRKLDLGIQDFWNKEHNRNRLKYFQILERWQNISSKVHAIEFDQAAKTGLLKPIEGILGTQIRTRTQKDNSSPDARAIAILQKLNELKTPYNIKSITKAAKELEKDKKYPKLKHFIGSKVRSEILDFCSKPNERLHKKYNITFPTTHISEPIEPNLEIDNDYLLDLLALLSIEQFNDKPAK